MSRHTVVRLIESFFRRWWLYLLPVLLLGAFGAKTVAGTKDMFRSTGTLTVASTSLVDKLSDVTTRRTSVTTLRRGDDQVAHPGTPDRHWFVKDVANRAGLTNDLASGVLTVPKLRASIFTWADGATLFHVVVTMEDPVVTQKVAAATIAAFTQNVLDANLADSQAAVTFWTTQSTTYQADVATARAAYNQYLNDHAWPDKNLERPADQLAALAQLQSDVDQATSRFNGALTKADDRASCPIRPRATSANA